jgi:transcriptional regulator with XRE-family HTH domain
MNSKQCRMARVGLEWTVQQLSEASGVNKNTISRFERNEGSNLKTVEAIKNALLATGRVEFEGDYGVRVTD